MSAALKLIISLCLYIPFGYAQSPAPTQAPDTAPPAVAETTENVKDNLSFDEAFRRGTQSYQTKKYEEALVYFRQALDLHPESATVLTNLGLSYYQAQKKGWAIALFRRALTEEPSFPVAEAALHFAMSNLEVKEIPHQIETYEKVRSSLLNPVSLNSFHLLTALFLFSGGFVWLSYLGKRKKALEEETSPPNLPTIGILLSAGFIVCLGLTGLKSYDVGVPRATVVADKVSVQTAPEENQSGLFDLYSGFEVIVRGVSKDWVQITYPGGMSGWVKKDALLPTSGEKIF